MSAKSGKDTRFRAPSPHHLAGGSALGGSTMMSKFCPEGYQTQDTMRSYPLVRHPDPTRNRLGNVPPPLLTFERNLEAVPSFFPVASRPASVGIRVSSPDLHSALPHRRLLTRCHLPQAVPTYPKATCRLHLRDVWYMLPLFASTEVAL
jgi:hypothetical protein